MKIKKVWKHRKKTAVILSLALLAGTVDLPFGIREVKASSKTQAEIDATQREKDNLEDELERTQENLDNLEGQRDSLKKELDYLNAQLSAVVANLEELEGQILEKEQEIAATQAALEEAKAKEEWQYAGMVAIVRCMHEKQEDNYLSILLSSGSLSELLNKADNIEKVVAYEQKMLREYKENRMLIEEQEARLQREKSSWKSCRPRLRRKRTRSAAW